MDRAPCYCSSKPASDGYIRMCSNPFFGFCKRTKEALTLEPNSPHASLISYNNSPFRLFHLFFFLTGKRCNNFSNLKKKFPDLAILSIKIFR